MIDPHALVDPRAELAPDVHVGPFSVIGPDVQVGAGTWIGPHVVIKGPTRIGRDNRIHQFASIGDDPQDKKYNGEPTRLEIGDGNVFREFCSINRGTVQDQNATRIGDDNLFMACTHVAHDCQLGSHIIMANFTGLAGHVTLGDWVVLSGYAAVHQFCKIGAHAFLANNAAVTGDVPPYVLATGQPAVPHSVNAEGLRRRDFSADQIRNIREAYRILYRSDLLLADASVQLAERATRQPELRVFVDFITSSTRGLIR
jgi:UDP-N-acetylglucosamine acyltransferase